MPQTRSIPRLRLSVWLLIAALLLTSVEAAVDRAHVHGDSGSSEIEFLVGAEQGRVPPIDTDSHCPHCLHLFALSVQCETAPPGMASAFVGCRAPYLRQPYSPSHQSPLIRPPIPD